MTAVDTPCINVCALDPRWQVCRGCGRTLAEIERWPNLSRPERISLMAVLRERLDRLRAQGLGPSA